MLSSCIRHLFLPTIMVLLSANLHAACGGGGGGGGGGASGGGFRASGGGSGDRSNPMGQAFRIVLAAAGGSASDGATTAPINDRISFGTKTMNFPAMGGKIAYTWSKTNSGTTIKAETGDDTSGHMVFIGTLASGKLTGTLTASKEGRKTLSFSITPCPAK